MKRFWMGLLAIGILLLAACQPVEPEPPTGAASETSADATLEPVTLGVGFIPSVQFATFYAAIDQGYYADVGLDVTLEYGFENDYLLLTATDEIQFMVGSGDQVILGRAQDLPVRYVMNWFTEYPAVIFAKADAGITDPADLADKRVGIPGPFGASYVAFRAILESAGLAESDVILESIGFTQAAAVQQDLVDAAVDYSVNGPVVLDAEGIETVQFRMDEYLHMPSNGLVTNETTIAQRPDLVRRMVQASLQGIAYTLENPDEAFEIALRFVPEAGGENEAINRAIFDAVLASWETRPAFAPGETRQEDWAAAVDFMARIGLIEQIPEVETLFSNEFLGDD
jgi:NitT/TauT family transport system substrate-binding protein